MRGRLPPAVPCLVAAVLCVLIVLAFLTSARDYTDRCPLRPARAFAAACRTHNRSFDTWRANIDELIGLALDAEDFGKNGRCGAGPSAAAADALVGGKRIRPVILCELVLGYEKGRNIPADPAEAALALEYIHTASLIIDDLPTFDADETRRGRPTTHALHGVRMSHMASVVLIAAAIRGMPRQFRDGATLRRASNELSDAIAQSAEGQIYDSIHDSMTNEHDRPPVGNSTTDPHAILETRKTAPLFELAFVLAALTARRTGAEIKSARLAGRDFGEAFQLADDIGDMATDARKKTDLGVAKNYANAHGVTAAENAITVRLARVRTFLTSRGMWSACWDEIVNRVWGMTTPHQRN